MVIDNINKYLRNLDSTYKTILKKFRFLFYKIYCGMLHIQHKIEISLPFLFYKIYKKIRNFFFNILFRPIRSIFRNIKYTIFYYTKFYKNYKWKEYIRADVLKDSQIIIDYYLNIFSISKWKNHKFLFIWLVFFYSILLLSNNLLYFLGIKFLFYLSKYIIKYLFIFIDFFFYTYLHFTRMPKFLVGIPYVIIVKNMYRLYDIIFNILPLLIYVSYWLHILYKIQDLWIWTIHRLLDVVEYCIISFAKSRTLYLLKRLWIYTHFYLTEEGLWEKLRGYLIKNWKYFIKYYIKYIILFCYYTYIKMPLKYLKKYFMRKIYVKLRIREVYAYLRKSVFCLITFIRFYIKSYFLNITYIFYIWKINSYYRYKDLLILFYGDALYWYKYLNYYKIMKYMSKYYIYKFLIYIYNSFSYTIKNLIFWCENIIDTVLGYIFIRFFSSSFSHHRIFKFLMPPLKK